MLKWSSENATRHVALGWDRTLMPDHLHAFVIVDDERAETLRLDEVTKEHTFEHATRERCPFATLAEGFLRPYFAEWRFVL